MHNNGRLSSYNMYHANNSAMAYGPHKPRLCIPPPPAIAVKRHPAPHFQEASDANKKQRISEKLEGTVGQQDTANKATDVVGKGAEEVQAVQQGEVVKPGAELVQLEEGEVTRAKSPDMQGTQAPAPGQAKPEGERVKDEEVGKTAEVAVEGQMPAEEQVLPKEPSESKVEVLIKSIEVAADGQGPVGEQVEVPIKSKEVAAAVDGQGPVGEQVQGVNEEELVANKEAAETEVLQRDALVILEGYKRAYDDMTFAADEIRHLRKSNQELEAHKAQLQAQLADMEKELEAARCARLEAEKLAQEKMTRAEKAEQRERTAVTKFDDMAMVSGAKSEVCQVMYKLLTDSQKEQARQDCGNCWKLVSSIFRCDSMDC